MNNHVLAYEILNYLEQTGTPQFIFQIEWYIKADIKEILIELIWLKKKGKIYLNGMLVALE